MQEDVLENLYKLLKEKFEPETEDINFDVKAIEERAFKELTEEYENKCKDIKQELLELKIEKVKRIERMKLAEYCNKIGASIEVDLKEDENLAKKEREIEEKLQETTRIIDLLHGKDKFYEAAVRDIRNIENFRI